MEEDWGKKQRHINCNFCKMCGGGVWFVAKLGGVVPGCQPSPNCAFPILHNRTLGMRGVWRQEKAAVRVTLKWLKESMRDMPERLRALTNLWLRALPNSRELVQTPRHFCRVDLLGGWCVFCGWAKIRHFTLDDKVLVLLSLSKWKLFAKWQGPFVVMQWVRDVDYKVVHSDRGGAKQI